MADQDLSRRSVLGAAAAGAGLMIVPRHVLGRGEEAPSDKLNIAAIGAGGKGRSDVAGVASENIVALCDIDWKRAEETMNAHPNAKRYHDYREMLDAHSDLDAVLVSTADHTHAVMTVAALERGLHVFTQKPLTRTIGEARMVGKAARKAGTATQMGNQGHAAEGTRLIREWIEGGVIGEVDRVEYWTNRPIWPQAIKRPKEVHEVPDHVKWDLWLGPAPERPYHPDYYHPFAWRGWWDFGTGAIGDIACHAMDAAFWILRPAGPVIRLRRVDAVVQGVGTGRHPDHLRVPGPRQPAEDDGRLARRQPDAGDAQGVGGQVAAAQQRPALRGH